MATIAGSLNRVADIWASLIVAAVWQSTVLAFVIAFLNSRLRRASPVVRYWLWQVVTLKLLIVPFWTVFLPLPALFSGNVSVAAVAPVPVAVADAQTDRTHRASLPSANIEPLRGVSRTSERISLGVTTGLFTAWLIVVAFQIFMILRQRSSIVRLLRLTRPVVERAFAAQLDELAVELALRRVPEVRVTEVQGSPFVCGVFRSVLVLPEGLADALEPGELRQVLLHELAHVKRGDLFLDWFPAIARLLFFFHPVAHWVADRILLERELACDQAAMNLSNRDAASYARMLVRVASAASFPLHASAAMITLGNDNVSSHHFTSESAG